MDNTSFGSAKKPVRPRSQCHIIEPSQTLNIHTCRTFILAPLLKTLLPKTVNPPYYGTHSFQEHGTIVLYPFFNHRRHFIDRYFLPLHRRKRALKFYSVLSRQNTSIKHDQYTTIAGRTNEPTKSLSKP